MVHESNANSVTGSNNPGRSQQWFVEKGLSHDAANEAAAAARRAAQQQNKQG